MHWGMFAFGMVCGWIILSLVGLPSILVLIAAAHNDDRALLMAENCRLRSELNRARQERERGAAEALEG